MEQLPVRDLFNMLCVDRKIRLQLTEEDIPNLHSRLCKMRAAMDCDFEALGEPNPAITSDDRIMSKIVSKQHLEDGTKLAVVEFSLGKKHVRKFVLLDGDESGT